MSSWGIRMLGRQGVLGVLALASLVGCGDSGPKTFKISGKVSFSGKPIPEGIITFEDSSTGIADSFNINNEGRYEGRIPAGRYGVSILPMSVDVPDTANSEGGLEFKKVDYIPNRYRSSYESKLVAEISEDKEYDVEMKPGGR